MIISLKLNCRVLADSTLLCAVNFYQDGNDCKGIALINIKKKKIAYHENLYIL